MFINNYQCEGSVKNWNLICLLVILRSCPCQETVKSYRILYLKIFELPLNLIRNSKLSGISNKDLDSHMLFYFVMDPSYQCDLLLKAVLILYGYIQRFTDLTLCSAQDILRAGHSICLYYKLLILAVYRQLRN